MKKKNTNKINSKYEPSKTDKEKKYTCTCMSVVISHSSDAQHLSMAKAF